MNDEIKYTKEFYDQDYNIKRYGDAVDLVGLWNSERIIFEDDDVVEKSKPPEINEKIADISSKDVPVYETDTAISEENNELPFKIGDRVYHPKHGKGVIEGFGNYSNKILFCQIDFDNVGRRILDPRISGIEKIAQ